jgi:NADH dehydrogenase FAD-containing subunit
MQVAGYKHVFAGGDVCMRYTFEEKTVTTALSHAAAIARNIQRVEKGMKPVDHQEIRGLFEAVIDFGGKPGLKVTVGDPRFLAWL